MHTHVYTSSTVFPKPGVVDITVLLARNEDSCFPQFQLKVQSPIEALSSSLPTSRGSKQVAMLAAAVAYLANCDEKDREATMNADEVISEILKDIQPADLPEWILAWLLCGEYAMAALDVAPTSHMISEPSNSLSHAKKIALLRNIVQFMNENITH
jgi:hypothetical protein